MRKLTPLNPEDLENMGLGKTIGAGTETLIVGSEENDGWLADSGKGCSVGEPFTEELEEKIEPVKRLR